MDTPKHVINVVTISNASTPQEPIKPTVNIVFPDEFARFVDTMDNEHQYLVTLVDTWTPSADSSNVDKCEVDSDDN